MDFESIALSVIHFVKEYGTVLVLILFPWYVDKVLPGRIAEKLKHKIWISQQQWGKIENLYSEILRHLTAASVSYGGMLDYYFEPGSEYDETIPENEKYKALGKCADESLEAVKKLTGISALYLSDKTNEALRALSSETWNMSLCAVCEEDGVQLMKKAIDKSYSVILDEAKCFIGRKS